MAIPAGYVFNPFLGGLDYHSGAKGDTGEAGVSPTITKAAYVDPAGLNFPADLVAALVTAGLMEADVPH